MISAQSENICPVCTKKVTACSIFNKHFQICPTCNSSFVFRNTDYTYGDNYPVLREHSKAATFEQKKRTVKYWLQKNSISLDGVIALDFGFGGGASLAALNESGAQKIVGIEPIGANLLSAKKMGLNNLVLEPNIFNLGNTLAGQVGFFLYSDSFEHETDVRRHLAHISKMAHRGSKSLLVLPRGDSLSRMIMQKYWIHNVPEHWVHYSLSGIEKLWGDFGWKLQRTFYPWKYISLSSISNHLKIMKIPFADFSGSTSFPFNFGEMGVIFEKVE